ARRVATPAGCHRGIAPALSRRGDPAPDRKSLAARNRGAPQSQRTHRLGLSQRRRDGAGGRALWPAARQAGAPMSVPLSRSAIDIKKEAGEWLERRDRAGFNEADQRELDAWLAASPAHLLAYHRVAQAWKEAERLIALRRPAADRSRFGALRATSVKIAAGVVAAAAL